MLAFWNREGVVFFLLCSLSHFTLSHVFPPPMSVANWRSLSLLGGLPPSLSQYGALIHRVRTHPSLRVQDNNHKCNMAKFRKIGIEFRQNFIVRLISNIKFGFDKGFRPSNLWHGAVLPSIWLKSTLNSSPSNYPCWRSLKRNTPARINRSKLYHSKILPFALKSWYFMFKFKGNLLFSF